MVGPSAKCIILSDVKLVSFSLIRIYNNKSEVHV